MEAIYTEIIERYLNGEMNEMETSSFEEKLQTDEQLILEFRLTKDLDSIIQDEDALDFRKELTSVSDSLKSNKTTNSESTDIKQFDSRRNSGGRPKWYLLAASIVVIMGLGGYFMYHQTQSSSFDSLYSKYYSAYPAEIGSRSGTSEKERVYSVGLYSYNNGDYEKAVLYFQQYINYEPTNMSVRLYLGISLLELNQTEKAIESFKYIIAKEDNPFVIYSKWYLSMAYLKTGNEKYKPEIKLLLTAVVEQNGPNTEKAQKILEKLE